MRGFLYLAGAALFLSILPVCVADWPTYQANNRRTGVVEDCLEFPLEHCWAHVPNHPPSPAWPMPASSNAATGQLYTDAMGFDRAYHTVCADGRVYYGSSTEDAVFCLDAPSGEVQWRFITDGPVRIPPVAAGGRVYAGSDDGHVYCLDARTGELAWKVFGGPESPVMPRAVIGNGRIISSWPVRCGPLVEDEKVYFTAGLFPSRGVYLQAVNAKTGDAVWKERISVSAQGHMFAAEDRLYVTTGRNTPVCSFRLNGQKDVGAFGATKSWGRILHGGSSALIDGDLMITGPSESGQIHAFLMGKPGNGTYVALGHAVLMDASTIYILSVNPYTSGRAVLRAIDRAALIQNMQKGGKQAQSAAKSAGSKWQVESGPAYALVKAGHHVLVGGADAVRAFDESGKQVWQGAVDGMVRSLAVSDGQLYASTDRGTIHCFGGGKKSRPDSEVLREPIEVSREVRKAAATALKPTGQHRKGYCLVLESGDGQLALEIARHSEYRVIGFEKDVEKVRRSRDLLSRAGLYGSRVTIHHQGGGSLPLPRYFANLILSAADMDGRTSVKREDAMQFLRPYGGRMTLGGKQVARGALEGAGEWTHLYAEPGNSSCSGDRRVRGTMDIQWFGRPGASDQVDRHYRNGPSLFKDGLLFVAGNEVIHGVDAYNGTILWRTRISDSRRTGAFLDAGGLAVDARYLYAASSNQCLGLHRRTGEIARSYDLPDGVVEGAEWGSVMVSDGILVGSVCKKNARHSLIDRQSGGKQLWYLDMPVVTSCSLFGIDARKGKHRWHYAGGLILNTTISADGKRVYFVETTSPAATSSDSGKLPVKKLFAEGEQFLLALDIRDGKVAFRKKLETDAFTQPVYLNCAGGKLIFSGSRQKGKALLYTYYAFDARTGETAWTASHEAYAGKANGGHGEQNRHPTIIGDTVYAWPHAYDLATGKRSEEWRMDRRGHGCGGVSSSAECLFWRGGNAWMLNTAPGSKATRLTHITRPGCWINIIPAGGLVMIPESSAGCACGYSIQTSIALVPREDS